jgi:hypothetical protein
VRRKHARPGDGQSALRGALPALAALLHTNSANANDADFHLNSAGRIVCSGLTNALSPMAQVTAGAWARLALTVGNTGAGRE